MDSFGNCGFLSDQTRSGEIDEMLEDAKALAAEIGGWIEAEKIKKMSVFDAAKDAGLEDWYDTLYSFLSHTVHACVRSLGDHLHTGESDIVEAIKNEPEIEKLGLIYTSAAEVMLLATKALGKVFNLKVEKFIEDTAGRIRQHAASATA